MIEINEELFPNKSNHHVSQYLKIGG